MLWPMSGRCTRRPSSRPARLHPISFHTPSSRVCCPVALRFHHTLLPHMCPPCSIPRLPFSNRSTYCIFLAPLAHLKLWIHSAQSSSISRDPHFLPQLNGSIRACSAGATSTWHSCPAPPLPDQSDDDGRVEIEVEWHRPQLLDPAGEGKQKPCRARAHHASARASDRGVRAAQCSRSALVSSLALLTALPPLSSFALVSGMDGGRAEGLEWRWGPMGS